MFDISLELDSLNPDTWKSVGATYKAMGKDTAAIYCFAKALKIDSTDYITYNEMANRYFVIGMYKEAQFLFGKAILYNPENAVLYSNYGMASEFAGEKDIAETYYKKSLQKNNENATAYYQLAGLYASQSKLDDAIKNLSLAIKYGSYTKADIENDTNFSSLKEDKGFKALLQKMK
jgi:tetratricopeptide (TPR) repeat protein